MPLLAVILCQPFMIKGKENCLAILRCCPEARDVFFMKLSQYPPAINEEDEKTLDKFVITMYDRSGAVWVLMRQDWTWLLKSRDHMRQFFQLSQL